MKKNRFKIILLLSLFSISKYQSQSNISDKQIYNIATPEVANMMRYVDFPEPDFIGKNNISVPIYTIGFEKLNIPIGLSYTTKGNRAADIATAVGLGWNLNAGGNLTVKVNDMNDLTETYAYYTTPGFEPEQSYAWHRQSRGYLSTDYPQALSDTQDFNSQLCINHRIWENDDRLIDSAPDFYYVEAPGFKDRFYFTRISNTQLKANFFISNAKLNNNVNLNIKRACGFFESTSFGNVGGATVFYQPDKFEITGDNGYLYTFIDYEYSNIVDYPQDLSSHSIQKVNSWYLAKIKDPFSGKEINFEYESYTNNYEHLSLLTLFNYINFGNYGVSFLDLKRPVRDPFPDQVFNRLISSKLVAKRLKKIITEKETIDFNYDITRLDYGGNALSSILVKNKNGNTIKQANFSYSYFDSGNCSSGDYYCKRLKLEKVVDSSLGTYSFYYDNNVFPPRNTSKVDFLGYFNNNTSNVVFSKNDYHPNDLRYYPNTKFYFYPDLPKDNILPFQLRNKTAFATSFQIDRTPSSVSKLGLLKKMIYPTGGSLELDYENDDFMYEGEKYILGSTRVNMMRLYDSQNTISKEIKYKYINEDNTSSGQINFMTTPDETINIETPSGIGFNTGAIIGYSRIIEETTGKGYIEKKYSNFNDHPDQIMSPDQNISTQEQKNFIKFMKFPSSYIQSFDDRRGKLLSVNYYKEGQVTPLKKEEYSYDYQIRNSLKVTKPFYFAKSIGYDEYSASNYVLTYFSNLKSSTTEDFFPGGSIKEENTFNYDDARLVSKKTITAGDTTEEFYRNAKDKNIAKLVSANVLDTPVEIEKKKNGKLIDKQETKYDIPVSILPSSKISYDLESNTVITDIKYDKYDDKGNLIQYTNRNGSTVGIIWGYNKTLPIAKIEGKGTDHFMTMLSDESNALSIASDKDIDVATEDQFRTKLDLFQSRQHSFDVAITTYTYDPLVGMTSMSPPSKIRSFYKYDAGNRLEKVVDVNNNIVQDYKYNYAPIKYYSSEKTKSFIKDCGSGSLGSTYTYIVPAYKYSSTISQADADQRAQEDININGQSAANLNGICTPVSCSLNFNSSIGIAGGGSVSVSPNSYYKASFGFSSGPNSTNLPWTTGVKIATIYGPCKPIADYSSYNGQVFYTIKSDGDVILKTHSGISRPNNTSYNYELFFPIN